VLLVFSQKSDLRHLDFMVLLRGGSQVGFSQRTHSLSSSEHKGELFSHKNLKLTDVSFPKIQKETLSCGGLSQRAQKDCVLVASYESECLAKAGRCFARKEHKKIVYLLLSTSPSVWPRLVDVLPQDKQSLPVQQLRAQLSRFAADNDRAHG
jgi:hypothetical protein